MKTASFVAPVIVKPLRVMNRDISSVNVFRPAGGVTMTSRPAGRGSAMRTMRCDSRSAVAFFREIVTASR